MVNKEFITLFAPPGSGKTTIGNILAEQHGYHFYDADIDLTPEQRFAGSQGLPITNEMRAKHLEIVHNRVDLLRKEHERLAVATLLVTRQARENWLRRFPEARLIYVEANRALRVERISQRRNHFVSTETAINAGDQFEPLEGLPFVTLTNSGDRTLLEANIRSIIVG